MNKMGDPSQFQGRIIFMSMVYDIIWGSTDNERECIANATLVTLFEKRFPAGRWSFLGPGSEKKWYSTYIDRPRGEWDRVAELMMIFGESGHPVFRATSPSSRGTLNSKGGGKLSMARGMGSPWHAVNRRRRTREGPEPACVLSPFRAGWHMQGEKDELTSCRGTVKSAAKNLQ